MPTCRKAPPESDVLPVNTSDVLSKHIPADTTSHEFRFVIDTLGEQTSYIKDVSIVNENDIWAVGEIYKRDSTGQWENPYYNLARWNGEQWSLHRIYYYYQGDSFIAPLRAVHAFALNDVWVASSQPMHWNGSVWEQFDITPSIFNAVVNEMWGSSSSDMYLVGDANGAIAHFDGTVWRKMHSGTSIMINDVWGTTDGSLIWACAWYNLPPAHLLQYRPDLYERILPVWRTVFTDSILIVNHNDILSGPFMSVWMPNDQSIYVCSPNGVYAADVHTLGEAKKLPMPMEYFPAWPNKMRGNNANDLVIAGDYFFLAHYNGKTFKFYNELLGDGRFWSVAQKGNIVVAVGETNHPFLSRGIVLRGYR